MNQRPSDYENVPLMTRLFHLFLFSQVKSPSKNPDTHDVSGCFSIFARNLPKTTRFPTVTRGGKGIAFGKKLTYLYSKVLTAIGCAIIPLAGVAIFHFCSAGFSVDQLAKIWALEVMTSFISIQIVSVLHRVMGEGGSLVAVALLLAQIVSSGAVIGQNQLMAPYRLLCAISPMHYAIVGVKEVMAKVFPARVRSHSPCQYFRAKTRKRTATSPVTASTRWIPTGKPSADPNPRNRQAP